MGVSAYGRVCLRVPLKMVFLLISISSHKYGGFLGFYEKATPICWGPGSVPNLENPSMPSCGHLRGCRKPHLSDSLSRKQAMSACV